MMLNLSFGILGQLRRDQRAATIVEFAVIAPVFLGFLMFLFDTSYQLFAHAILRGEVNAAGRASTLETATAANRALLDQRVTEQVQRLVPHAQLSFKREAFFSYRYAQSRIEPFNDANGNNVCDNGESYVDLNNNAQHDLDGARSGGGNAKDVVIYTVTMEYDRLFPVHQFFGFSPNVKMQATTLLRNQPFTTQAKPISRNCP